MVEVPIWLIVAALVLMLLLARLAFRRRGSGDMIERQRRENRIASVDEAKVLALPEVRAALQQGHKIEAIRIVREHTGLGLKEAKELVESRSGS